MVDAARDEQDRRRALRRTKRLATGLLVAAFGVFLVASALEPHHAWAGYVRAFAEASMVGALADWFAVTALFRHPLRIPIPHTAIIPARKDDLGRGLGAFVESNFLTPELVAERLRSTAVAGRLGAWLAEPEHASQVGDQLGVVLRSVVDLVDDAAVENLLRTTLASRVPRDAPRSAVGAPDRSGDGRRALPGAARRRAAQGRRRPRRESGGAPGAARARVAVVGSRAGRRSHLRPPVRRVDELP